MTCSRDPLIKLIDLESMNKDSTITFKGHEMSVTTVAACPDQTCFSSGSRDCTTKIWDIET